MRRTIYLAFLLFIITGGIYLAVWMLMNSGGGLRLIALAGAVFPALFAGYLLWDDFLKPNGKGQQPLS